MAWAETPAGKAYGHESRALNVRLGRHAEEPAGALHGHLLRFPADFCDREYEISIFDGEGLHSQSIPVCVITPEQMLRHTVEQTRKALAGLLEAAKASALEYEAEYVVPQLSRALHYCNPADSITEPCLVMAVWQSRRSGEIGAVESASLTSLNLVWLEDTLSDVKGIELSLDPQQGDWLSLEVFRWPERRVAGPSAVWQTTIRCRPGTDAEVLWEGVALARAGLPDGIPAFVTALGAQSGMVASMRIPEAYLSRDCWARLQCGDGTRSNAVRCYYLGPGAGIGTWGPGRHSG
jgi:hypothetical protein